MVSAPQESHTLTGTLARWSQVQLRSARLGRPAPTQGESVDCHSTKTGRFLPRSVGMAQLACGTATANYWRSYPPPADGAGLLPSTLLDHTWLWEREPTDPWPCHDRQRGRYDHLDRSSVRDRSLMSNSTASADGYATTTPSRWEAAVDGCACPVAGETAEQCVDEGWIGVSAVGDGWCEHNEIDPGRSGHARSTTATGRFRLSSPRWTSTASDRCRPPCSRCRDRRRPAPGGYCAPWCPP